MKKQESSQFKVGERIDFKQIPIKVEIEEYDRKQEKEEWGRESMCRKGRESIELMMKDCDELKERKENKEGILRKDGRGI